MFERLPTSAGKGSRLRAGIPAAVLLHAVVIFLLYLFGVLEAPGTLALRESSGAGYGAALESSAPRQVRPPWMPDSVATNLPDTVRLGTPRTIHLGIMPMPRDTTAAPGVRLARVRHATVEAPSFLVEARSPALQLADSVSPLEWEWSVTPTEPGPQRLRVNLEGVVEYRGRERRATLYAARRDVVVVATRAQRVARFAARNWWWLAILALLPLLRHFRRR